MEELGFGMFLLIVVLAITGVFMAFGGSLDHTVVASCKERGYWQTGQLRIICYVEGAKP